MPRGARDAVAIHIEAHGEIEFRRRAQRAVEHQPFQRVDATVALRRLVGHRVPQLFERAPQHVDADIGAAAAPDIERRRREKPDAQE